MLYKLRLPLYLQPLRQHQHEQYTRTRMLELRNYETRNKIYNLFELGVPDYSSEIKEKDKNI